MTPEKRNIPDQRNYQYQYHVRVRQLLVQESMAYFSIQLLDSLKYQLAVSKYTGKQLVNVKDIHKNACP